MCGRTSLDKKNIPKQHRFSYRLEDVPFEKNFNIRPSQQMPIILAGQEKAVMATWTSKEREFDGTPTVPMNVRHENLLLIPRFRALLSLNRCIIPVDGYFDWKDIELERAQEPPKPITPVSYDLFGEPIISEEEKERLKQENKKPKTISQKYRFSLKKEQVFGLAGIWREIIHERSGERTKHFAIIMTDANSAVRQFHERMPIILSERDEKIWLTQGLRERRYYDLLKACDSKLINVMAIDSEESLQGNYVPPAPYSE